MTDSQQLATLWVELGEVQQKIRDRILPLGERLSIEDPELMIALEELNEKIDRHFYRFKLVAEARRDVKW